MILLKATTETQKHNQHTFKKQFRSFPYDYTKNSNRLSKSIFLVFHIIVLKTSTDAQKHNQQTFKKKLRSFP